MFGNASCNHVKILKREVSHFVCDRAFVAQALKLTNIAMNEVYVYSVFLTILGLGLHFTSTTGQRQPSNVTMRIEFGEEH